MADIHDHASDESDSFIDDFDDIPEVNLSINLQPYTFEPSANRSSCDSDTSSSEDSENNSDAVIPLVEDCYNLCNCSHCTLMSTVAECRCCYSMTEVDPERKEEGVDCIILHEGFIANCLNRQFLKTSYYEFIENNGPPEDPTHEVYRHIAYRRFTRWIWGILGRNRKGLPSCVVTAVRNAFQSQRYSGFKYPQEH
ncbi:hypothetical protein KUTeg_012497 [Tegillarca granosa]|uniref:P2X purinoreceptor 7 intracellular domain-containing protein n=1 Tax=Tegillarca granosa TaxID=220873 RepID=A0ABQ9F412_TEGGR|nr:hypothetical protein KUTeg_012497 [Tegillarca granosa]